MRMVDSMAASFATGNAPGSPRHTGQTCVFGSAPKVVAQPQNIFEAVPNSTCVSRPMTGSYFASTSSYDSVVMSELRNACKDGRGGRLEGGGDLEAPVVLERGCHDLQSDRQPV